MSICYIITKRDLLVAQFALIRRNRFLSIFRVIMIAFIGYTAFQATRNLDVPLWYKIAYVVVVIVIFSAILVGISVVLTSAMVLLRKNTGVLGEHRLTITDEGLVESTIHNESMNRWSAYHRTVSTKSYLMLYVTDTMFHFIPKKRPLLEGDLVAFEAALREKTKKP